MIKPTLSQINLVCGDVDASIAFYRRLGVEIPDAAVWRTATGGHHVSASPRRPLSSPHDRFRSRLHRIRSNLEYRMEGSHRPRRPSCRLFRVPSRTDVDDVFRDMTGAGYRGLQEPHDAFWGARYAIIEDPDGAAVCLMSSVSPDRKSQPPDL